MDVVDLGILVKVNWGGKGKKQHKIRIVWQVEEVRADNKPHQASKRYTLSLHEKAALRKDLESWRGRPFTAQELEGFDVEQVIGIAAILSMSSRKRRTARPVRQYRQHHAASQIHGGSNATRLHPCLRAGSRTFKR